MVMYIVAHDDLLNSLISWMYNIIVVYCTSVYFFRVDNFGRLKPSSSQEDGEQEPCKHNLFLRTGRDNGAGPHDSRICTYAYLNK